MGSECGGRVLAHRPRAALFPPVVGPSHDIDPIVMPPTPGFEFCAQAVDLGIEACVEHPLRAADRQAISDDAGWSAAADYDGEGAGQQRQ